MATYGIQSPNQLASDSSFSPVSTLHGKCLFNSGLWTDWSCLVGHCKIRGVWPGRPLAQSSKIIWMLFSQQQKSRNHNECKWQIFTLLFSWKATFGHQPPQHISNSWLFFLSWPGNPQYFIGNYALVQTTIPYVWNPENYWHGRPDWYCYEVPRGYCVLCSTWFFFLFLPWPYYIWLVILIHKLNQIKTGNSCKMINWVDLIKMVN